MEIYAEYLFLENFITGLLLLILTGKICGVKADKRGCLAGAAMCGIYSFVIFAPLNVFFALLSKLIFSIALIIVVFYKQVVEQGAIKISKLAKIIGVFYLLSFSMGGITIATMYMGGVRGITQNTALYIDAPSYITIAMGVSISYLAISLFASFIKQRTRAERDFVSVKIEIGLESWELRALVDTGNFLVEPVTGRPVGVISLEAASRILPKCGQERFCLIPYKSVGKDNGLMEGFRPDCVRVGCKAINKIVLGIYQGEFSYCGEEKYEILLHKDIMEGGIATNV